MFLGLTILLSFFAQGWEYMDSALFSIFNNPLQSPLQSLFGSTGVIALILSVGFLYHINDGTL